MAVVPFYNVPAGPDVQSHPSACARAKGGCRKQCKVNPMVGEGLQGCGRRRCGWEVELPEATGPWHWNPRSGPSVTEFLSRDLTVFQKPALKPCRQRLLPGSTPYLAFQVPGNPSRETTDPAVRTLRTRKAKIERPRGGLNSVDQSAKSGFYFVVEIDRRPDVLPLQRRHIKKTQNGGVGKSQPRPLPCMSRRTARRSNGNWGCPGGGSTEPTVGEEVFPIQPTIAVFSPELQKN